MSDIIKAREILGTVVDNIETMDKAHIGEAINVALQLMYRKKHKAQKAPNTSARITPKLRDTVLEYAYYRPEVGSRYVAEKLNVNQGRISEILEGRYGSYGSESLKPIIPTRK